MAKRKKGFMLISTIMTVHLLLIAMGKHDTLAWFVSETNAYGSMVNATTEDLLFKSAEVISYEMGGIVIVKVELTNIADVEIPIQLEGHVMNLSPEDTFSEVFYEHVPLGVSEINFQLTGFHDYINELLTIPLDEELLLETYPKEAEPDDIDKVTETDDIDKVTEPDDIDKVTEPDDIDKVTGPDDIDKVTEPDNIDKVTEPDESGKIAEPEDIVEVDSEL